MNLWLMVIIVVFVVTCGGVIQKAIEAFAQRPRELPGGGSGPDGEEVRRLREEVETLTERVERLQEEQGFLTRLLEERPGGRLERRPGGRLEGGPRSPDHD